MYGNHTTHTCNHLFNFKSIINMARHHRNKIFSAENASYHTDQSKSKALKAYHELVPDPIYKHMPTEQRAEVRGKPWYYLTKSERIAIENRRPSTKMTHEDYIKATLDHKINKWKKKHPEPAKDDLFYKEEHPKWVQAYEEAHDRIVKSLQRKYITEYTRPIIYKILESKAKESKAAYTQAA